jgi:uroporphyrin-3 C-methyltransferase
MVDTPTDETSHMDSSEAADSPKPAERASSAKILDDIAKVKPRQKTRAQIKGRRRVIALILLLVPVLAGIAWLSWQQWQLRSRLPALESRVASVQESPSALSTQDELSARQEVRVTELLAAAIAELPQVEPARADPERDRRLAQAAAQASQAALAELETRVVAQQQAAAAEITQLRNQVAELGARLRASDADPSRGWRLLEAEYLLAMAGRRLRFERDIAAATTLFEMADAALADSASGEVYPLRQALARELASLRSAELPDIDSLFLRLDILIAQADAFALAGSNIDSIRAQFGAQKDQRGNAESATPSDTLADSSWRGAAVQAYDDTLAFLSSVFVWRQLDEPAPSLVAMRANGVREFVLLLEQAKLALLASDAILFTRQLTAANTWLAQNAESGSAAAVRASEELAALAAIDIAPPLPVLGEALRGVRELNASMPQ